MLRRLFNNFWYKIISLVLAVLIWGIIQGEQVMEVGRDVHITIKVPEQHIIRESSQQVRQITVRGPRVLISEVPNRLQAEISLPKNTLGQYRTRLTKAQLTEIDPRLAVSIHDPYMDFFIDRKYTRSVPIKELLVGVPKKGHILKKVSIKPRSVKVTGLRSEVIRLKSIATEPVEINGIAKDQKVEVNLIPPTDMKTSYSPTSTEVAIKVGEEKVNKLIRGVPIEVVGSAYMAQIRPLFVSVTIQGTPATLNFIRKKDITAFIPMDTAKPGNYQRDIKVRIPPGTALIEVFPEKASVDLSTKRKKGSH